MLARTFGVNGGCGLSNSMNPSGSAPESEFLYLLFQIAHAVQQIRQLLNRDHLAFGLPVRSGRDAEHATAIGDVTHHARLGADDGLAADLQVVCNPGLGRYHNIIAQGGAAGKADLAQDQAMPADDHVVRHMDQVVDLRPLADDGGAERAAVNRGIGADLDIIMDNDVAELQHLPVAPLVEHVAKAV